MEEVASKQIPKEMIKAKELLCIDDEDMLIAILRYYKWDQDKLRS